LAEVISRVVQAVLGDLIPVHSIVQHEAQPAFGVRTKKAA